VKKRRKPIEHFKIGDQLVPIHNATPIKPKANGKIYPLFSARYYPEPGKVIRCSASSLEVLRDKLRKLAEEAQLKCLRGKPLHDYELANALAAAWGKGIYEATLFGKKLEDRAQLMGVTPDQIYDFWERHHNQSKYGTPIPEVVELFLAARRKAGNSDLDLRDLKLHLGWFCDRFKCPLRDVTADEYDQFFAGFDVSPVTLKHYRGSVERFLNWAIAKRFLPHDHPGVPANLSEVKHTSKRLPLMTRAEREQIIECCDDDERPLALLAAYCPGRTCELNFVSYEDINYSNSKLAVYADEAKTSVTRFIHLVPELIERLKPYRERKGRISRWVDLSALWKRLAKRAGVTWRRNGWRKAVLSYLVAYTQNFAGVAAEGGTSVEQLKKTYVTAVEFEVGAAYFGLTASDFHPLRPVSIVLRSQKDDGAVTEQTSDSKIVSFNVAVAHG
jgi:integrase